MCVKDLDIRASDEGYKCDTELLDEKVVHEKSVQLLINQHGVTLYNQNINATGDTPIAQPDTNAGILPGGPVAPMLAPTCLTPAAQALADYDVIISLDTEYVERSDGTLRYNEILSYQYTALARLDNAWLVAEEMLSPAGPTVDDRLTLAQIIAAVFRRFGIGYRRAEGCNILLVAHFGVAEWAALKDRLELAREHLEAVRGLPVSFHPFTLSVNFGHKNYASVRVTMRDTWLLAPTGMRGLDDLAAMTVHKKLALSEDVKSRMDLLKHSDPERYTTYAINDCRVALEYYLRFLLDYEALLGVTEKPLTLGDAAVKAYLAWLQQHAALTYEKIFGYEHQDIIDTRGWERKRQSATASRRYTTPIAADAYLGGLNIAYVPWEFHDPESLILDIDFAGAYPAALAVLPVIDWSKPSSPIFRAEVFDSYALIGGGIPVAIVQCEFEFPAACAYPCLPVPSKYGLLYPLRGTTTCTGVEIALARRLGARIRVLRGDLFPTLRTPSGTPYLAFAEFLGVLTRQRTQAPKGSLRNLMLKEVANSFYGKLAQGIDARTVYNLSGGRTRLEHSKLTTPH